MKLGRFTRPPAFGGGEAERVAHIDRAFPSEGLSGKVKGS